MNNKHLPVKSSKGRCLALTACMFLIYLLDNLPVNEVISYRVYTYVIKPSLWLFIVFLVLRFPRYRYACPLRAAENINTWSFILALIYILVSVGAGFIDGFGKSPYSRTLNGILLNIVMVALALIGKEFARAFIINSLARKERFLLFISLSFFITLLSYPLSRFIYMNDTEQIVRFLARQVAPEFSQNLLACYLAFLGGWVPPLIYMSIIQAFNWLSPILPNLKWITAALIGIMCPIFSLSAMQNLYIKESRAGKKLEKEGIVGWMFTSMFSIGVIWFVVGVFPVYPSVIATGSMEPLIKPGDVIIVEKIRSIKDIEKLCDGDVIQFQLDGALVSHRITEIIEDDDGKKFRTKGDNNTTHDSELVNVTDIKGKIVYVVPKIGWPTLLGKKRSETQSFVN